MSSMSGSSVPSESATRAPRRGAMEIRPCCYGRSSDAGASSPVARRVDVGRVEILDRRNHDHIFDV